MDSLIKPLVSIVSPIYKVEAYLEESLDAMFSQTYKNIEYVFVNDNTPDNSMQILDQMIKKYNVQNVIIINHEKNLGLCGVRNSGLKAASGDFIMIVDSDDILPLNSVETLVKCALDNNADFVEADFAYYPGHVGKIRKREFNGNKTKYISTFIAMKMSPCIWGKLYSRDLFFDVDNLFVLGRDNVEDAFSTPILADRAKNIAYTNMVCYYYRVDNPNSYSRPTFVGWNKVDDMLYCVNRHEDYFKKYDDTLIQDALKEKKYYIKTFYYLKLQSEGDRKKLIKLFPEIEDYVKQKPLSDRIYWFMLNHNYYFIYRKSKAFFNIISGLYGKLKNNN